MSTIKEGKRSVAIWPLIGILAITAVFGTVIFLPMAYAAEEFECIHCYSGTYTLLHKNKELPMPMNLQQNGIIMSKSENKFLDNATVHVEGIQVGFGKKREGYQVAIFVDPDGDMIIGYGPYTGLVSEVRFLHGTGKYKDIKGSFTSSRLAFGKKAAWPGTYQRCRTWKGTFELPPK